MSLCEMFKFYYLTGKSSMGKVLILYESNNRGYTKRMAEIIADGAKTVEGTSKNLNGIGVWGKGHDQL